MGGIIFRPQNRKFRSQLIVLLNYTEQITGYSHFTNIIGTWLALQYSDMDF